MYVIPAALQNGTAAFDAIALLVLMWWSLSDSLSLFVFRANEEARSSKSAVLFPQGKIENAFRWDDHFPIVGSRIYPTAGWEFIVLGFFFIFIREMVNKIGKFWKMSRFDNSFFKYTNLKINKLESMSFLIVNLIKLFFFFAQVRKIRGEMRVT